jgi:hypothetical protein
VASPDGETVFVTGESYGVTNGYDYVTIAYDSTTGSTEWMSRYDGPAHYSDMARSIAVIRDGSEVFVTGLSDSEPSSSGEDYATAAYDAISGAERWVSRYDGPAGDLDEAVSVVSGLDGSSAIVTGYSKAESAYEFATLAYEADARLTGNVHRNVMTLLVKPGGRPWAFRRSSPDG